MIDRAPLRVPVGHDAYRWNTFRGERTLVVAARTVTSTVRILESLPALLRGDHRVTVVFAHDPTSAFDSGVLGLLHEAGCRVLPWEQLDDVAPDLILSASENIDVPDGNCPVLVLPHGVGFQKLVPDSRGPHERLSGVVPDSLLESGRAWLAISHPSQEEQLLATHPKIAGHTLLVGDPCFDELTNSAPMRPAYREALGVAEHQQLVMVSSTWGPTSLLGTQPDLPARLLAQLPYDRYRVGAIVHPNVWAAHGSWTLHTLQAAALDAGLLLMPAVHAWRPALVAADVLIGDHGSVSLYGAALGTPLLLAAFGADAVPGTAAHAMGDLAPRLDPRGNLRTQIEDVVREHKPEHYADVAQRAFAEPGHALARLRATLYRLLELSEPASESPYPLAVPRPDPPATPVTAWRVTTDIRDEDGQPAITVARVPAAVAGTGSSVVDDSTSFSHLMCTDDERDGRVSASASVIVRSRTEPTTPGALRWVQDTLDRLPGSLLAVSDVRGRACLAGFRNGPVVEASATGALGDPKLLAAVVYACFRAGLPLDDCAVTVRTDGRRREDVVLRVRPDAR
nr:hypothetical protein OG999_48015 [Streptomyces sp. NBC_00886]